MQRKALRDVPIIMYFDSVKQIFSELNKLGFIEISYSEVAHKLLG